MVKSFNIKPDLRKADIEAKLMAQQKRKIGAIFRSGYKTIEGTMSGMEESLRVLFEKVRFVATKSASVVKFI